MNALLGLGRNGLRTGLLVGNALLLLGVLAGVLYLRFAPASIDRLRAGLLRLRWLLLAIFVLYVGCTRGEPLIAALPGLSREGFAEGTRRALVLAGLAVVRLPTLRRPAAKGSTASWMVRQGSTRRSPITTGSEQPYSRTRSVPFSSAAHATGFVPTHAPATQLVCSRNCLPDEVPSGTFTLPPTGSTRSAMPLD